MSPKLRRTLIWKADPSIILYGYEIIDIAYAT